MNTTPQSERTHIAFIGKRNVGKSSLVNKFVGQDIAIVSETPGTTTDPVKKAMELLPFGPVVLIDTAGIDDVGELGEKRIDKTFKVITESDFALLVLDAREKLSEEEKIIIQYLENQELPFLIVLNKSESGINYELVEDLKSIVHEYHSVSCSTGDGINELKEKVITLLPSENELSLIGELIKPNDVIVLVIPIDPGAPKGRVILPQVQALREALDKRAIVVVAQDKELKTALCKLADPPKLVVTDSQAIKLVSEVVPAGVPLTTFSILMARYKGDLPEYVHGLKRIEELKNGDKVLIAEACSHHVQEDDIGRIKIPRWLKNYTNKNIEIDIVNGHDFPANLSDYKLIIHCGACMFTRKTMQMRIKQAKLVGVPIVNYGVAISYMHGAIPRALKPFSEAIAAWEGINRTAD